MPGIKATVERRPNDSLLVTNLEVSSEYKSISKSSVNKPGFYSVKYARGEAKTSYRRNGRISSADGRIVVIPDGAYETVQEAAKGVYGRFSETAGRAAITTGEFDMLYSPAGRGFGSSLLREYDPRSISDAYAFASLCAKAMENSLQQKNVFWFSEFGGSAIFTQSMQILARKNITFQKTGHVAYMHRPSTDPVMALQLTKKLGFKVDKQFAKTIGFSSARMMIAKASRARDKKDIYSWKDYASELGNGGLGGVAVAGAGITVAGLFVSSPALGSALATAGTAAGLIGGGQLLWTKAKKLWS